MIKNILLAFVFVFQFSIAGGYELLAQSDSVFDDSDLADIEGLDGGDEDSELEEEFGDLSDDSIEENFELDDFEMLEEEAPESKEEEEIKSEETMPEDDFDKEDYEVLSDRPGYEIITDEELEKEFSDIDNGEEPLNEDEGLEGESTKSENRESLDESEDMESVDEPEDMESVDEPEDMESVDEPEGMESVDEPEGMESVDEPEGMESVDEPEGMESVDEPADEDMKQLEQDIESMEGQEEELEQLEEELEQVTEEEKELQREEEPIQRDEEEQGWKDQEETLGLDEPEGFEEPSIEGLPVEEEMSVSGLNLITNIRYLTEKDQIVIDTSEIASYQERSNSETNQLIIEILQSRLGENLHWPYVLRDFNTDFGLIKADQKDPSTVRVLIQLKEGAGFPKTTLSEEGNQIIIGYGEIVNNEIVAEDQTASSDSDMKSILPAKTLEDLYFGNIEFSGAPVSFHVIDAPIKQVLRFISEESGLNMVIDESVSGTVTLKLEDVPWDQALHTIFKVKSLGYTRDGNVITVLPLSKIEERTKRLKEISDRQKSLSPFQTKVIPIMYAKASDIEQKVKDFSTPSGQGLHKGGRIIVHEESNTLVVVDTAESIKKISAMAEFLDKPPQQVAVEAKIVEASKSFARNFGFNWDLVGNFPVNINASGFMDIFGKALTGELFSGVTSSNSFKRQNSGIENNFSVSGLPFIGDLNSTLNLAESDGSVQVLTTSKVVTKSGQSASITKNTPILILSGRNTALGAGTAAGGQAAGVTTGAVNTTGGLPGVVQETTQTQDITLSLQVTPTVTSSGSIAIQLTVNYSTPGGQGGAFKTDRSVITEILAKNGQTLVISGIYEKNETQTSEGVPLLGKIPILGHLFKGKNSNFSESELLMFITPNLVEQ